MTVINYLAVCLLLCTHALSAIASPTEPNLTINIKPEFKSLELGYGLNYRIVEHPGKQPERPGEALAADGWQVSDQDSLSFGFSPEPRWILFRLANSAPYTRDMLIEISNPYLDYIDVYQLGTEGALVKHIVLGDKHPANKRPMRHANFLAPLTLQPSNDYDILIRVQTTSTNRIPITVWDHQHFVSADYRRTLFQSIIYGVFIAISSYYLLLYIYIREKAFIYWSFSILGILFIVTSMDGTATALLWPDNIWLSDYFIMLGICGTCGATSLFSKAVLKLEERPRLALAMNGILMVSILLWLSTFIAPYQTVLKLALGLAVANALIQIVVYLFRLFDRYEPAKYVVIAIFLASLGVIINVLTVSGRLPITLLGINAVGIGVTLSVLFYSLALSNRMNLDRAARERAQLQLTMDLDEKVTKRTEALQKANEQLLEASITDGLTALLNRRHFDEIFDNEFRSAYRQKKPIAVLMMDIDHFKQLNDNYGHQFGDRCLKQVAEHIVQCLSRPPDICARYGGEEFVVVLPNTPLEGAVHVAESIRKTIEESTFADDDQAIDITISIGVASTVPATPESQDSLMKLADDCLYRAKRNGRNRTEHD
ncbi:MAG: diguanylate cyclase [Ketobacteraceae bacterium]|nr:diguanylate cyclase [Ketobacteraceae bacterium]